MQSLRTSVSDTEVMAQLMASHHTVMSIMSSRQASLQVVRGFWARGDVRGALAAILQSAGIPLFVIAMLGTKPSALLAGRSL